MPAAGLSHGPAQWWAMWVAEGVALLPWPLPTQTNEEKATASAFSFCASRRINQTINLPWVFKKKGSSLENYTRRKLQTFSHGTQTKLLVTVFRTRGTHYYRLFIVNELYKDLFPTVVAFAMAFNILFSNSSLALKRINAIGPFLNPSKNKSLKASYEGKNAQLAKSTPSLTTREKHHAQGAW